MRACVAILLAAMASSQRRMVDRSVDSPMQDENIRHGLP